MSVKYRVYPTLLNEFDKYLKDSSPENHQKLINRINRIADFEPELLQKFKRGIDFENAVIKNTKSAFAPEILAQTKALLPAKFLTQYKLSFIHKNTHFYGFADIIGENRIIDIKTTSKYNTEKYKDNFQNLYLYSLINKGFTSMEYVIYDFEKLHLEKYNTKDFEFEPLLAKMDLFVDFLEENRQKITDKKIFVSETSLSLFG